jgi:hypothetical protein
MTSKVSRAARKATKPKLPKLIPALELIRIARRLARINRLRKRAESRRADLQTVLLLELDQRKATSFEHDGVKVTRVQQAANVTYDVDALLVELTAAQRARVTVRALAPAALDAEVAAGRIDAALVARHRIETPKAPYVLVTGA